MININGTIFNESEAKISTLNRGFAYGDAVFETLKSNNKKPVLGSTLFSFNGIYAYHANGNPYAFYS